MKEQNWWELRLAHRDEEDNKICLATHSHPIRSSCECNCGRNMVRQRDATHFETVAMFLAVPEVHAVCKAFRSESETAA